MDVVVQYLCSQSDSKGYRGEFHFPLLFSKLAEDLLILLEKLQCYKARRSNSNISRGLESVSGNLVVNIDKKT